MSVREYLSSSDKAEGGGCTSDIKEWEQLPQLMSQPGGGHAKHSAGLPVLAKMQNILYVDVGFFTGARAEFNAFNSFKFAKATAFKLHCCVGFLLFSLNTL